MVRPCLDFFFITHHSLLNFRHSSLITYNTPSPYTKSVWHHHWLVITQYFSIDCEPHTLTQRRLFSSSFFLSFFFFPDSCIFLCLSFFFFSLRLSLEQLRWGRSSSWNCEAAAAARERVAATEDVCGFVKSWSNSDSYGSNCFDSAGNRSRCVSWSGPSQICCGPKDHGWPVFEVPKFRQQQ